MAERLDSIDFSRPGRPAKYPWAQWADGTPWRIVRGHDYDVLSSSMAAMLRSYAARKGLTVHTTLVDIVLDGGQRADGVEFQFFPAPASALDDAA